jgi:hypothetical protein
MLYIFIVYIVTAPILNRRVSVELSSDENNRTLQNIMVDKIDESNKDDDEVDGSNNRPSCSKTIESSDEEK